MIEKSPRRAFVASTRRDLAEHRLYVIQVLRDAGLHVDPMENWTADPARPLQLSTDRVRGCDLCVLLVGHHIGHVPKGHKRSITQQEYDAAKRAGLDVLVFVQDLDAQGKPSKRGGRTRIQRWRADLTEAHTVGSFGSRPDSVPLAAALSRWLQRDAPSDRLALRLPEVPSPRFIGRESVLADMRQDVTQSETAPVIHVLAGMGGAGKSEIALQYAHRYSERYSVVWWIRAETEAGAREDLAALAEALGLVDDERHDVAAAAELARSWLEQHGGWLVVFDNALSSSRLKGLLPTAGSGHVLVTSRDAAWGRIAIVHEVASLERVDSVAFLQEAGAGSDAENAETLADELGDLPLALEQARGLMEATGIDLEAYLKLYRKNRARLLQERLDDGPYPHTVATTWAMSIERLTLEAPNASSLLQAISLLAPDPVPLALFEGREEEDADPDGRDSARRGAEDLEWDTFDLLSAQAAIQRYSLARVAEATVTMHRLVQVVVQEGLDRERRRELLGALVRAMLRALRSDGASSAGPGAWTGHLQALLSRTREEELAGVAVSDLHGIHGSLLWGAGRFEEAYVEFEAALAARPDDSLSAPEAIPLLVHFAHLSAILRDRDEGLAELRHLTARVEALVSTDPLSAMARFRDLAFSYRELDEKVSYRDAADRALEIARETLAHDDIKLADYIYEAASANHNAREGEDPESLHLARRLHEEGIEISQRLAGPRDPSIISNLGCLGDVLKDLGEIEEAIALRERVLGIVEEHYGATSANAAHALGHLSRMYTDAGLHESAVDAARRAVAIHRESAVPDPDTVWDYVKLSRAIRFQHAAEGSGSPGSKGLDEAVEASRAAVDQLTDALGPDHRRLVGSLIELASALTDRGDGDEARTVAERVRAIATADDHVHFSWEVAAYEVIAQTWLQEGDLDQALGALQAGLRLLPADAGTWREVLGDRLSSLYIARAGRAFELGRHEEARTDREQSVRCVVDGGWGEAAAWIDFGHFLLRLGEVGRVEEAVRRFEAVFEARTDNSPDLVTRQAALLGELAAAQGDREGAVSHTAAAIGNLVSATGTPCARAGCAEPGLDWGYESLCATHIALEQLVRFEGERAHTLLVRGSETDAVDSLAESLVQQKGLGSGTCSRWPCEEPELEGESGMCARHEARLLLESFEGHRARRLFDSGHEEEALKAMSRAVVLTREIGSEPCSEAGCPDMRLTGSDFCPMHEADRELQKHAEWMRWERESTDDRHGP